MTRDDVMTLSLAEFLLPFQCLNRKYMQWFSERFKTMQESDGKEEGDGTRPL